MNGFQIIESEETFLLKYEIGSSTTPRIWQYIDAIAMLYSFARCIDQIVEVITMLANGTVNIGFALYEMEFAIINNMFQLLNETGTFQIV